MRKQSDSSTGVGSAARYQELLGHYRFYLGLTIGTNLFVYAITGALVAFVVSLEVHQEPVVLLGLLVPFLLNSGTGFVYARGLSEAQDLSRELRRLEDAIGVDYHIQGGVLLRLLWVSVAGYATNTIGLIGLTAWGLS